MWNRIGRLPHLLCGALKIIGIPLQSGPVNMFENLPLILGIQSPAQGRPDGHRPGSTQLLDDSHLPQVTPSTLNQRTLVRHCFFLFCWLAGLFVNQSQKGPKAQSKL